MRGYKLFYLAAAVLIAVVVLQQNAFGQYWFQSGVNSGYQAAHNSGASIYIQTVKPQNLAWGAFGFWVGETLSNGAFIQVGYEVPNASGDYPAYCDASGCNGTTHLAAGYPAWFWEYFPAGYSGTSFYGGVGQNDSVGANGTFNRYWLASEGNTWDVYFNNQKIGSADLGTSSSGQYAPAAYAELANTNSSTTAMKDVLFKNLSYYKNGGFSLLQSGTTYIGYGTGSLTNLQNPYGVAEVLGYANYFAVGSGIPIMQNGTSLWSSVYHLQVNSQFGNAIGAGYYSTFSKANFSVQQYFYITSVERVVFAGWQGSGAGSYTGPSNSSSVRIEDNATETALWDIQYYVNASSKFGSSAGSGWYAPNATASVSIAQNVVNTSGGTREVFAGWSDGYSSANRSFVVSSPVSISAQWQRQYLVALSTGLGIATGSGWYNAGSTAHIALSSDYFNSTSTTRIAFYSWNGIYNQSTAYVTVNAPVTLTAVFRRQHLVGFAAKDSGYSNISVSYFVVNGHDVGSSMMLFDGMPYTISGAYYKGVIMPANITANVSSSIVIPVRLPVYDVGITAQSLLRTPLNASASLTFRNGTSYQLYLGPAGSVVLKDVPFGYVTGYAKYGLLQEAFTAENGSQASMLFITPIVFLPVVVVVIVMGIYELVHRRRYNRQRAES